jgi:lysophospholipase L1-like esterase
MGQHRIERFVLYSLISTLLFCNIYYFFIRRGVSPGFYINMAFRSPMDPVISPDAMYIDLMEEYTRLNEKQKGRRVTVFVGDSITKRFNLQEYFPDMFLLNRAIFSDTTAGLLIRWDRNLNTLDIDKLFVMAGYNDLKYRTNAEILHNMSTLLSKSTARKIYVQSILPVAASRPDINARIAELNRDLKKLCLEHNYYFIDLHSHFLNPNNTGLAPGFSRDGVHPNAAGYSLWSDLIKPMLYNE